MKIQKQHYNRFVDSLAERGLVDRDTLAHVVQQCSVTGSLLAEILVKENLVSDWEIARVSCEVFGVPYLPVSVYPPDSAALDGLDPDYLRQYAIVPLDRRGQVLTVAVPGAVPVDILDGLVVEEGVRVFAVVGSVEANRKWLGEHLPPSDSQAADGDGPTLNLQDEGDWAGIFDAGDRAVQEDLGGA